MLKYEFENVYNCWQREGYCCVAQLATWRLLLRCTVGNVKVTVVLHCWQR